MHYRFSIHQVWEKTEGSFESGDYIEKINTKTEKKQKRKIGLERAALKGTLLLNTPRMTASSENDIILSFYAGQRSPMAEVIITIPKGIRVTKENTFINVIGRGEVSLKELPKQSVGRTGTNYSYSQVGNVEIKKNGAHGQQLIFRISISDLQTEPI